MESNLCRPSASETDKAIFTQLLDKISEADSYFCCGGTVEFLNRPMSLYYRSKGNTSGVNCLDFLAEQQSQEDFKIAADKLLDFCVPAPHGRGNQTVYDDSYRLAKELPQNDFSLSLDILGEAGAEVLPTILNLVSGRHYLPGDGTADPSTLTLEPRLYKLNAYSKGGFFKSHRDTPKGNGHLGTLLFGLPIPFEGGALRVVHAGKEITFDWGSKCTQGVLARGDDFKLSIPWAFLFSDVEHEVLPVLSGTRVTIAYDIFASKAALKTNVNVQTSLCDDIKSALQNPNFLPTGSKVAIALSHAYPMPRGSEEGYTPVEVYMGVKGSGLTSNDVATALKGSDAILHRDLKSLGLGVAVEAVFEVHRDYDGEYDDVKHLIPKDGYEPEDKTEGFYKPPVYYTSNKFSYNEDVSNFEGDGFESYVSFLRDVLEARLTADVMWIKKPAKTFTKLGSYLAYANESSIKHCYAAIAFVITIPPYGEGPRIRV